MPAEDWYKQKINELKDTDTRVSALSDIKNQLHNCPPEITIAKNLLKAPEIFQCLNKNNSNDCNGQLNLAMDILSICMSTLDLDKVDSVEVLQKYIQNSNPEIQTLALYEIIKHLRRVPPAIIDRNVIQSIIDVLTVTDTRVGSLAIEILSKALISNTEVNIKDELLKKCENNETVRCRVYEICVNLAKNSPQMLSEVEPILNKMLDELNSMDVLLQLNILELCVSLAEQNHGIVYLENKEIFHKISRRIEQISENPLDTLLIPGFMKFFGKIAYYQPQKIIANYPNMLQCLFDCLMSEDVSILPTAFDTLGNLAHTSQGKVLLDKHYSERLKEVFQQLAAYLRNLPTDLKIREINALEVIFKTEGLITEEISKITKNWWHNLSETTNLRLLLEFCKNPFPDIKNAVLSFVKVLIEYKWGILALKDTAGFVEYLLDRRVEFNTQALLLKYEINKILSETTEFDVQTILQLKKYVEEGFHYVEGVVEVAVEGN